MVVAKPQRYGWYFVTDQATFATRDGTGALVFNDSLWLLGDWDTYDEAGLCVGVART